MNNTDFRNDENIIINNKRIRTYSELEELPLNKDKQRKLLNKENKISSEKSEEKICKEYKNDYKKLNKKDIINIIKDIKNNLYFKYYLKKNKIKLNLHSNKNELIELIELWRFLNIKVNKIQKIFRNSLTYKVIKLRGPALKNRNICVNECDFCSLEPLKDIENKNFFSYKDKITNCIFGFDICSLWMMYKKKDIIIINQSYKNLKIEKNNTNKILFNKKIYNIKHNNYILETKFIKHPYNRNIITSDSEIYKNVIELYYITNLLKNKEDNDVLNNEYINIINVSTLNTNNYSNNEILRLSLENKIKEIRNKSLNSRINDAFIEIQLLDFIVDTNWFINLNIHQCFLFLKKLKHIWDYGFMNNNNNYERILDETKKNICYLYDPFYNININFNENEKTLIEIKTLAIYVIENLIYLGVDFDNKRLGAIYVLIALTSVSSNARNTLNWLFESFN